MPNTFKTLTLMLASKRLVKDILAHPEASFGGEQIAIFAT
jgi:hypothetical protein